MTRRFFADESFWNTPIAADAAIDADNERLMAFVAQMRAGGFWLNCTDFTIPVYEVTADTPLRTVHRRWREDGGDAIIAAAVARVGPSHPLGLAPGFGPAIPIPELAMADPAGDHHLAIIDWERMTAWDMCGARRREDGEWETLTGISYPLDGSGVFERAQFDVRDGESIHLYGPGRAAGVPIIAGLVRYEEVCAGVIPHKLVFGSSAVALQQFLYPPACWTDGPIPGGLPEGATLQLDPALDLAQFPLSPAGRIIARALQAYGAVCVDGAGGNVIYVEGLYGHAGKSWEGMLLHEALEPLGYEHFRLLRMEGLVQAGDVRHPVWPVAAEVLPEAAERAKEHPWPH